MTGAVEGALVKAVIDRAAPAGWEWIKTALTGKTLLVLGPARVGKTSFLDYLQYGLLRAEQTTDVTVDVTRRRKCVVKLGKDGGLILRLRKPLDVPGQVLPLHQVRHVEEYLPDCIIVVLDASSPLEGAEGVSSISWLEQFCMLLGGTLRKGGAVIESLRSLMIVMNKIDRLADTPDAAKVFEARVRTIVKQHLTTFRSHHGGREVPVMPCTLVKNKLGSSLIDEIIDSLALSLSR